LPTLAVGRIEGASRRAVAGGGLALPAARSSAAGRAHTAREGSWGMRGVVLTDLGKALAPGARAAPVGRSGSAGPPRREVPAGHL